MIKQVSLNQLLRVWILARVTLTSILFALSTNTLADTLHIAVASNFIAPIKQLATQFEQETNNQLQLSFASSGKLFAQIQHGAPFDVFLSADNIKPSTLVKQQLALPDSLIIYAQGKLVLWSINPMPSSLLKDSLLAAKRIAIANPKLAPYGKAAVESLRNLAIWPNVKGKLVQGENIAQAYQFVYSQNADLGLIALSQVLSGKVQGHTQDISDKLHRDIEQAAVILSGSQKKVLAKAFMAYLMRPDVQEKIRQFGYSENKAR
ncbi:molybdate ABC transporter substrate-binding protein [Marinomonas transparens]|uniref:Molybdate ABC transporter substrate-binding protein n=1 Tax=Marinomonas transparens TaxID=2795388 RepID=A0A934MWN4_9GAMM|nr:molybdate ABC transporter substrate-binding protein [Marinomonas transparens]MBJ7538359.1 molybdate ABC transporter substrate-binding protein [Marinomonas transparens]